MSHKIPEETISVFSRTISNEAQRYGFRQIDFVRLINALMDSTSGNLPELQANHAGGFPLTRHSELRVDRFPLESRRIQIRPADRAGDRDLLENWMQDDYGKHFLLSCATAQRMEVAALLQNPANEIGIVLFEATPIGGVAFLDLDRAQRRAELRKLIGVPEARGKGFAEEATTLWLKYGAEQLGLEKFYVSTLQTHLRNIRLNESIGFRVEGILEGEIRIGANRHDVLRMGLTAERFRALLASS